jgi:hypothetical protein
MPYCRKCGAKLDEDARFCHVCGTPVVPVATTRPTAPTRRRPFYILPVAILIAVLLSARVIGALFFLPFYPVHFNQTNHVPEADVDNLLVDFQADVAHVNIFFENLSGNMVMLNVTADGNVGIFDDPNRVLNVTFNHQTANNSAIVIASISRATRWPLLYNLNVNCDVYIDPSANLSLYVRSSVGDIVMNADANMTLQDLDLETATGSVDVSLSKGVIIRGIVSLKTTTGSVQFRMDKADVSGNVSVNLQSTIGSVNVDLTENQKLSGNVTVSARTTIGGVNLSMVIDDDVGARIESHADLGEIKVDVQKFSGNQTFLQSDNYPAGSNFLVNLRTTTGGININATYESSVVLSATKNP